MVFEAFLKGFWTPVWVASPVFYVMVYSRPDFGYAMGLYWVKAVNGTENGVYEVLVYEGEVYFVFVWAVYAQPSEVLQQGHGGADAVKEVRVVVWPGYWCVVLSVQVQRFVYVLRLGCAQLQRKGYGVVFVEYPFRKPKVIAEKEFFWIHGTPYGSGAQYVSASELFSRRCV